MKASVHHARFLELGLQDDPLAVRPAWGYANPESTETYDTIADAFQRCDERLLLLGEPGAGKTTALLHIAAEILRAADRADDAPIPVIVNLSKLRLPRREARTGMAIGFGRSRGGDTPTDTTCVIEDWLVGEISAFPGLDRATAREWLAAGRFAVLLDGLDEFNDDRRSELATLLNTTFFRDHPAIPVVVCSRVNEYAVLKSDPLTRLTLKGAVTLQPLSEAQVGDYLRAARAEDLLASIAQDEALRELSRTPLTLSMLVLAYAGNAPVRTAGPVSLSDTRFRLFDSYVAQMLQRQARRDHGVVFDTVAANDVPASDFRFRPDAINVWLGWLALVMSVRMRTTFAPLGLVRLLMLANRPERQWLSFWTAHAALGIPVALCMALVAIVLVPATVPAVLTAAAMVGLGWLLLPIVVAGGLGWRWGLLPMFAAVLGSIMVATALASHLASSLLPGNPSPHLLLPAVVAVVVCGAYVTDDATTAKSASWIAAAMVATIAVTATFQGHFLRSPGIDVAGLHFSAIVVAATVSCLCLGSGLAISEITLPLTWSDIGEGAATVVIVGTALLAGELLLLAIDPGRWEIVLGTLVLAAAGLASVDSPDARRSLLVIALVSIAAAIGGTVNGATGAAAGAIVAALLALLALRSTSIWRHAEDTFANVLDRRMLSRSAWTMLAAFRRVPWRRGPFLRMTTDAFLLKRSGQDFEFTHRLLRDHFALRELMPRLDADGGKRLQTIAALGYQGEAALDLLAELATDGDPAVRATAVTALTHIPSPTASRCIEARLADREPAVRQAVLAAIMSFGREERARLLPLVSPLGDGSEVDVILRLAGPPALEAAVVNLFRRMGDTATEVLARALRRGTPTLRRHAAQYLGEVRSDRAREALVEHVGDRDTQVLQAVIGALAQYRSRDAGHALERLTRDRRKIIREAAVRAYDLHLLRAKVGQGSRTDHVPARRV